MRCFGAPRKIVAQFQHMMDLGMQNFQIRSSSYGVISDILCSLIYPMPMHVTKARIYKDRNTSTV